MPDALSEFFNPVNDPHYDEVVDTGKRLDVNDLMNNGSNVNLGGFNDIPVKSTLTPPQSGDNGAGEASLSQYMSDHPGASYEDVLQYMATQSDEWAEKYLDYLTERGELDRANEYTANREDTAYQRLVSDLRAAGLNPAMMYGSSATISPGGSQGYIKMAEGANSRSIENHSKLRKLVLALMNYELDKGYKTANTVMKGIKTASDIGSQILKFLGL